MISTWFALLASDYQAYYEYIVTAQIAAAFFVGVFILQKAYHFILRMKKKKRSRLLRAEHMRSISGEDVNATKLDLARALLDMNDFKGAELLLKEVSKQGDLSQKQEAKALLQEKS